MIQEESLPWYKHALVWMIIAIPSSAVLAGFATLYLAVTTDDGLVADDYYKQGLAINVQIERLVVAKQLGIVADIKIESKTGFINIDLDKGRLENYPSPLILALKHASNEQKDRIIQVQHGLDNQYVGYVKNGVHDGVWHIELSNQNLETQKQWRLAQRVSIKSTTQILLESE